MLRVSSSERKSLIRLASSLPAGSSERKDLLFYLGNLQRVRSASQGPARKVWAFSISKIFVEFFSFFEEFGKDLEKLGSALEKEDLNKEQIKKINDACEEVLNKLKKLPSLKTSSRGKTSNLLMLGVLGGTIHHYGKKGRSQSENVSFLEGLVLVPLVLALAPIFIALTPLMLIVEVVVRGMGPLAQGISDRLVKEQKSKKGLVQNVMQFASRMLNSKANPDPFGDRGAVFDVYANYIRSNKPPGNLRTVWDKDNNGWRVMNENNKQTSFIERKEEKYAYEFKNVSLDQIGSRMAQIREKNIGEDSDFKWIPKGEIGFIMHDRENGVWWGKEAEDNAWWSSVQRTPEWLLLTKPEKPLPGRIPSEGWSEATIKRFIGEVRNI
jgi:hypothetical protein